MQAILRHSQAQSRARLEGKPQLHPALEWTRTCHEKPHLRPGPETKHAVVQFPFVMSRGVPARGSNAVFVCVREKERRENKSKISAAT